MLRNVLAASLRNLTRNGVSSAVSLVGLAVGFAAAMLIALFVRHELTFDHFIPGYENLFRVSMALDPPGGAASSTDTVPAAIPEQLKLDFPQILAFTRAQPVREGAGLRTANFEAIEEGFYWVDANFLDVLPLSVIAGDARAALAGGDGVVLTRRMARKYFGLDFPLGQTLQVDRDRLLTVRAVLEDLPSSTHLNIEVMASAALQGPVHAYLRLAPGSASIIRAALPAFLDRHMPSPPALGKTSDVSSMPLVNVSDIHMRPAGTFAMTPAGDPQAIRALLLVGALIVLIAGINFVNLMTALATRRAVEVAIRKTVGGDRGDLMLQFFGESVLHVLLGALLALGIVEIALPHLGAFLDRHIVLRLGDAGVISAIAALVLGFGVLAGTYPALVLSSFRPATVLKEGRAGPLGTMRVRQALVVAQFAILIALLVTTTIVYRQLRFGIERGLSVDTDQLLTIRMPRGICERSSFRAAIADLPGVRATACSADVLSAFGTSLYRSNQGREAVLQSIAIGPGALELMGLKPLAGRFFDGRRLSDVLPLEAEDSQGSAYPVVINEAGARRLGFASPSEAIGATFAITTGAAPRQILGVVPDFSRESVQHPIEPTFYENAPGRFTQLNVKLGGRDLPATLRAIDELWDRTAGTPRRISRAFVDDRVRGLYRDLQRESTLLAIFTAVAMFLACLGLFGLASFTAERRTKEIGVRKAMGAQTGDVMRLLLWQFSQPVLWATLIAWPMAAIGLDGWLRGFAYRIELAWWVFAAASLIAWTIALSTVAARAVVSARARPVAALRHE